MNKQDKRTVWPLWKPKEIGKWPKAATAAAAENKNHSTIGRQVTHNECQTIKSLKGFQKWHELQTDAKQITHVQS